MLLCQKAHVHLVSPALYLLLQAAPLHSPIQEQKSVQANPSTVTYQSATVSFNLCVRNSGVSEFIFIRVNFELQA